jgi:hypothetical protein
MQPLMSGNQFESGNEDDEEEELGAVGGVPNLNPIPNQEFNLNEEVAAVARDPEVAESNQYQVYFYDSKEMVRASVHKNRRN